MSAEIPSTMPLSDLLKSTGYNCPESMQGKTFDEATSGADLENNKEATIDVSNYTDPVEITPTQGKDGMKKATITLDNIPSGGSDIPSVMTLNTYNDDAIMLFGDKTKLTRLFILQDPGIGNGWVDDTSQIMDSLLGENCLLFGASTLLACLPALCIEYDNKMYKAPVTSVADDYKKYDFAEVQSQATPPTSDTPSGTIAGGTTIHLSTTETGGTIYYDNDGTGFLEYEDSHGIEIVNDTTILAVVAVDGKFTSEYLELTFTVE